MLTIGVVHPLTPEQLQMIADCGDEIKVIDCVGNRDRLFEHPQTQIMFGHPRKEEFDRLENLKWVHMMNTGADRILQWLQGRNDMIVTCTRGHSAVQMSEHAIAGLFYIARDLPAYEQSNREYQWKPDAKPFILEGTRALVLGVGGIGDVLAKKLNALGVQVRGVNSSGQATPYCSDMHTLETIQNHLEDVDHVFNCLPGSERTRGFVDARFLNRLKPGGALVSISRGSVIDEKALIAAVDSGQLRGAVLDVTSPEPPAEDSPLYAHPRILVTGHQSWKPGVDGRMGFELFVANLKRYVNGDVNNLQSVVDAAMGY